MVHVCNVKMHLSACRYETLEVSDLRRNIGTGPAGAVAAILAVTLLGVTIPAAAKTTTLKVRATNDDGRGNEKLYKMWIGDYEKMHPGVKIQLSLAPYDTPYVEKVIAETVAGIGADVIYANNFTFPRHETLLSDLTPFMKASKLQLSDLVPACREAYRRDGKLLLLPYTAGAEVLFMNPTLISSKGLPLPDADWTMDDFMQYCAKLTSRDGQGKVKSTGAGYWGPTNEGVWWPWAYGADILNGDESKFMLNTAQGKKAFADMRELIAKGYVNGTSDYNKGVVGFQYGGPWMITQFRPKFKMAVAAMPTGPIGKKVTSVFADGWGILRSSKNKAEAWRFIEFLFNKENQIALARCQPPTLIAAARDKRSLDFHPVDFSVFVDALGYGRNFTVTRKSNLVVKLLAPELDAYMAGKRGFEEAMGRVEKPIDTILKTTK